MNKKTIWWMVGIVVVVILVVICGVVFLHKTAATPDGSASATQMQARTLVATATYSCDQGKTITATYYNGSEAAAQPAPGQPPVPTGSVDVSIGGAATTTLAQTVSADGARYANADGSLVFWSKGNTALIMNNNTMNLDYTNCTTNTAGQAATTTQQ